MVVPVAFLDLTARLGTALGADDLSVVFDTPYILVDITHWQTSDAQQKRIQQPNCPVIALAQDDTELPPLIDLIARSEDEVGLLAGSIHANPVAASMLVRLLRNNEKASVMDGLFAESLAYSCLQNGATFISWLAQQDLTPDTGEDTSSLVLMERCGEVLTIVLNRPAKRNAYSAGLRDALHEALVLAFEDESIERVVVKGAGKNFSAGGDLVEFGSARDGALAHVSRVTRSNAALLDRLKSKTEFHLHGACIGAGIELPSFSEHVSAAVDSFFQLPEVAMGLIPGAGGTVSILNRIGRVRTAQMAISNQRIDTTTALAWGLIDEIS